MTGACIIQVTCSLERNIFKRIKIAFTEGFQSFELLKQSKETN